MLVRRAEMIQVECVARGYVAGSGWKDYQRTGCNLRHSVACGLARRRAAAGADLYSRDEGQAGHDENIPFSAVEEMAGPDLAARLRELTLAFYSKAASLCLDARHHHRRYQV